LAGAVAQLGERLVRNEEVRGSTPLGSTSLRSLRELRLGEPAKQHFKRRERRLPRRSCEATQAGGDMKYVYILRSIPSSDRYYVGVTDDLKARLSKHNAGEVLHTSKYKPWSIKTYISFSDEKQAIKFEKYLKTASGRAFSKKRL
jgi:putative endonuclease